MSHWPSTMHHRDATHASSKVHNLEQEIKKLKAEIKTLGKKLAKCQKENKKLRRGV